MFAVLIMFFVACLVNSLVNSLLPAVSVSFESRLNSERKYWNSERKTEVTTSSLKQSTVTRFFSGQTHAHEQETDVRGADVRGAARQLGVALLLLSLVHHVALNVHRLVEHVGDGAWSA